MSEFLQFVMIGLATGALYALAAQGLVLIYRGSGVLNFAQGALATGGAFIFYDLRLNADWPVVPALIAGLLAGAILALAIDLLIMRRLRRASPLMKLVATLGALLIIQSALALHYGTQPIVVATFLPTDPVTLPADVSTTADRLVLLGLAVVTTLILWQVYRRTRFGLATTAVTENERAAAAMGWSPARIAATNWALGGMLAALAGILLAPTTSLQSEQLTQVVIAAFAGALIANFRSFPMALAGALGVGVIQALLTRYVNTPGLGASVPFIIIIGWLIFRGRTLPVRGEFLSRLPSIGTGRIRPAVIIPMILAVSALLLWVLPSTWVGATTTSLVTATILLSIVVVTGYCGQLALGQYALAGVGALIAARLVDLAGFPFLLAMAGGVLLAVLAGVLMAMPALRVRGANLAVATLGIGVAISELLFQNPDLIGGISGTPISTPNLFGLDMSGALHPERYAVMALLFFVLAALVTAGIRKGAAGLRMIAVRENERAAASLGVSVVGTKVFAFGVASALAALGGILLTFQGETVAYGGFNLMASVNAVAYTVIGGLGYLAGPLLGAVLVTGGLGTEVFNNFFDVAKYLNLISGIILVLVIVLMPDGQAKANILLFEQIRNKFRRGREAEPEEPKPARAKVPRRTKTSTLDIKSLTVRFGGVVAVDDLSIKLQSGKVVGLIGPNGAGKTTVVDAVTGMLTTGEGSIELDGEPIGKLPAHRRSRLGIVRSFQSLELFEEMTVMENIKTACGKGGEFRDNIGSVVGSGRIELTPEAHAVIEEFDLGDDLERFPGELSYGKRRLVGIARAVAAAPAILILDEPAAGLSATESDELGDLITRLAGDWGIGILIIEHNVDLIMRVSDEVTAMNFGKTIAAGEPAAVRNNPTVRTAYLGLAPDDEQFSDAIPVGGAS